MRIIGIDPGLRRTGWGVVALRGGRLGFVASGICASGRGELSERLLAIRRGVAAAVAAHAPDAAAIERTFVNADPAGALLLGQARGAAIVALAEAGLAVAEYAPSEVKKGVVGSGRASKEQVATMVGHLLPGARADGHDAWDALAIAICRAHRGEIRGSAA